ncbi:DUF1295 domain-containing protein [Emticicia sp. TH156]|uniref:DUF1295 domain-containing protein n=1 Tax=Emticicia sp. TH156 TaxID=2067454 RepID=UPI001E4FB883|nr:DUF1295 domain-containing protein [Emticicia sp. TH156]
MMKRIVLLLAAIIMAVILMLQNYPFWQSLVAVIPFFTVLWVISLVLKNTAIVDIFWGFSFMAMAWFYRAYMGLHDHRSMVFCIMVTVWGVRLTLYLASRNIGKDEDYRYKEWRKEKGSKWPLVSFFQVFMLQGFLLWVMSTLFAPAMSSNFTSLKLTDYLGLAVWSVGFLFESIGDWQLATFKKKPENKGKVLQTGLWGLTRHPNYFGDALQWWGYYLFTCTTGQFLYVFSPLLMTFLLVRVSGVALLEKRLAVTKPEYARYMKRVSSFIPGVF